MNNLKIKHIQLPDSFDGLLAIGDVHGDIDALERASSYAENNNLFLLSLGDIVDYGPNSVECFVHMNELINNGSADMVLGNHELKNWKYFVQKKEGEIRVKIQPKHWISIDGFERDNLEDHFVNFLEQRPHIIHSKIGDMIYVFAHGGVDHKFWKLNHYVASENYGKVQKSIISTAMFGQIDYDVRFLEDGQPNRVYNWVQHIPNDTTVIIGHSVRPEVTRVHSANHGDMYFVDTGSQKGGFLSGIVIKNDNSTMVRNFSN